MAPPNPAPNPDVAKPTDIQGTPDAPALKRRPVAFALSLCLYALWMAILIIWAVQLRHVKSP